MDVTIRMEREFNSTSITATAGATSGNISVTANNSCGSGTPRTLSVSVTGNTCPAWCNNREYYSMSGSFPDI